MYLTNWKIYFLWKLIGPTLKNNIILFIHWYFKTTSKPEIMFPLFYHGNWTVNIFFFFWSHTLKCYHLLIVDMVYNLAYQYCFIIIVWVYFAKQNHCMVLQTELWIRCTYYVHNWFIRMLKKRICPYLMHAVGCLSQTTSILSKYLVIC